MSSELYDALLKGNHRKAEQSVRQELKSGADATQLVYEVVLPALGEVGKRYNCEEYFVPELLIAARAAKNVMSVLMPALLQEQILANNNIVVSGVVAGDLHDLGINIINTMLESVGFRVVYLGVDIRADGVFYYRNARK
ncbi:MAG: B12-binding domain-containing protein [Candidatus Staskawiczbacteria bacterium]|nr:B12-binding domain-containing protein [Candidatus Staskawiczbacteria bacterium]